MRYLKNNDEFKVDREQGFGKDKPLDNEYFIVVPYHEFKKNLESDNSYKLTKKEIEILTNEFSFRLRQAPISLDKYGTPRPEVSPRKYSDLDFRRYTLEIYKSVDPEFPGFDWYFAYRRPKNGVMASNQERGNGGYKSGYSYKCDGFEGLIKLIASEIATSNEIR